MSERSVRFIAGLLLLTAIKMLTCFITTYQHVLLQNSDLFMSGWLFFFSLLACLLLLQDVDLFSLQGVDFFNCRTLSVLLQVDLFQSRTSTCFISGCLIQLRTLTYFIAG